MKNVVRAFVIALTLVGSVAYAQINAFATPSISVAKVNSLPMPCCPPDDPHACGIRDPH